MRDQPDFLLLPQRARKPRVSGLTHVLDKGMTIGALDALLEQTAEYIDVLKVGWGIAYVDPHIADRVALCRQAGVTLCLGGTLLEVCAGQGRVPELARWAHRIGVEALEVSNGLGAMAPGAKTALVQALSGEFVVLAETGVKDSHAKVSAVQWIDEMEADIDAGAHHVIAEGRESGTVGLYREDGSTREGLVEAIAAQVPLEKVIFEAPTKSHQTWFVTRLGSDVGLGNVGTDEVLALETLRLGLRADTALVVPQASTGALS